MHQPNPILDSVFDREARRTPALVTSTGAGEEGSLSGEDVITSARSLAAALVEYGLKPGTDVGIVAPWGADAIVGLLAATAGGAVPVLADPGLGDGPLRQALATATHVLASDTEQLDRVVSARPDLPELDVILVFDPGPRDRPSPAMSVDAACARGANLLETDELILIEQKAHRPATAPALSVAVPGGKPYRIRNDALAPSVDAVARALELRDDDVVLARVPVPIVTLVAAAAACLDRGAALVPDAGREPLSSTLLGFRPTVALLHMDDLEEVHRLLEDAIASWGWAGRRSARWAVKQGSASVRRTWVHGLAESLALRRLRECLGGRLRSIAVFGGGATAAPAEFVRALGIGVVGVPAEADGPGPPLATS